MELMLLMIIIIIDDLDNKKVMDGVFVFTLFCSFVVWPLLLSILIYWLVLVRYTDKFANDIYSVCEMNDVNNDNKKNNCWKQNDVFFYIHELMRMYRTIMNISTFGFIELNFSR